MQKLAVLDHVGLVGLLDLLDQQNFGEAEKYKTPGR